MLGFFTVISFFIHALSLAAIYLIYQKLQKTKNNQVKEIDQLMHSYIEQIQKENHELQAALHKRAHLNHSEQTNAQTEPEKRINKEYHEQTQHWEPELMIQTNDEDFIETSLESRVLQLHRAGVPVGDIAKQLHCGKTEASLIIQFQNGK